MFKDAFTTVWDTCKAGNLERLRGQVNLSGAKGKSYFADDRTKWLENTPLHIAVKHLHYNLVKVLVYEMGANPSAPNGKGMTPIDYCKKFIKDEASNMTMMGLLEKTSKSTTVDKRLA
jgi:ankyrin repeat protein